MKSQLIGVVLFEEREDAAFRLNQLNELRLEGFELLQRDSPESLNARLKVLHQSMEGFLEVYLADPRPTLVISCDEAGETMALQTVVAQDDVVRGPISPQHMAIRLRRLLQRDAGVPERDVDSMTGLMNRRAFGQCIKVALSETQPGEHQGLIVIDGDRFKSINDEFGHQVGDQLLVAVAEALKAGASPEDRIARLGGDEFGVLLKRYDASTLLGDATNILRRASAEFQIPNVPVPLTFGGSAGLAVLRQGLTEPQLMQQAESAMYDAKLLGRGQLVHFEFMANNALSSPRAGDADLERFTQVTKHFSDRLAQMVSDMGRRLIEGARREALQDALTGANNRRYFDERLARELGRAQDTGLPLSLMLIDIDNFHDVNVLFGWPSGDAVLRHFTSIASASIRLTDWLARYGGEEFCIVLPDTSPVLALEVAERVRAAIEMGQFRATDSRQVPVTVSIGLTTLTPTTRNAVELVDQASGACIVAKASGKNRVVVAP